MSGFAFNLIQQSNFSTHVQTEDTISREVRDGKLYSKRLLKKSGMVPKWGKRFAGSLSALIIEESIVDPKEKTITTYTRNIYERALVSFYKYCRIYFT